jgi:hypothetical protein
MKERSAMKGQNTPCRPGKTPEGKFSCRPSAAVIVVFILVLTGGGAWSMTPATEQDLSDITGQAGVSINADVTMNITIGTMAWGDATGVDTGFAQFGWSTADTAAGYVGVTGFSLTNLRIKARENDTYGTGYTAPGASQVYNGSGTYGYSTYMLKPITIDVGSDPEYVTYNGATFVRIGLGSLQVSADSMSMNVALGGSGSTLGQVLGTVSLGGLDVYVNPTSYVDIYNAKPGSARAVFFTLNVVVDRIDMDYLSWGDSDGAGTGTGAGGVPWFVNSTAGYIGLYNMIMGGPVKVNGTLIIDVGTAASGVYAAHGSTTVVHIIFQRPFNISVGQFTAQVRLDGTAGLDGAHAGTLGDIYMAGIDMTVRQGSWVDIWAH